MIAKVDADLDLAPGVLADLEAAFVADPSLGLAGLVLHSAGADGVPAPPSASRATTSAARRSSTAARASSRSARSRRSSGGTRSTRSTPGASGWTTRSFALDGPPTVHLRPPGAHDGVVRGFRRWGECAWAYGADPVGVLAGGVHRMRRRPVRRRRPELHRGLGPRRGCAACRGPTRTCARSAARSSGCGCAARSSDGRGRRHERGRRGLRLPPRGARRASAPPRAADHAGRRRGRRRGPHRHRGRRARRRRRGRRRHLAADHACPAVDARGVPGDGLARPLRLGEPAGPPAVREQARPRRDHPHGVRLARRAARRRPRGAEAAQQPAELGDRAASCSSRSRASSPTTASS